MFDKEKATQLAAYFIWKRGGRMSYLKLIKLMYFAERAFILKYGERLTGDNAFSMPHGPVLTHLLEFAQNGAPYWNNWIESVGNYELAFRQQKAVNPTDPLEVFDALSPAEKAIADQVFETYGHLNRWALRDLTHRPDVCPEWENPQSSVLPIDIEKMIRLHTATLAQSQALIENVRETDAIKANTSNLQ